MSGDTYINSFAAKLVNQTSINLTWSGNYDSVSIYQSTDKDKPYTELTEYTRVNSYTMTNLIPNTLYFFYIIPYDIYGEEGQMKDTFITTPYNIQITDFYAGYPSMTSIPLYWHGIYYAIRIRYKKYNQTDDYIKDIYPIVGSPSYTVTGLDIDTSYNFQLIPYDLNDFSGTATNIIYTKTDYQSYIGNIYLGAVTSRTANVSWDGKTSYVNMQYSTTNITFDTKSSIYTSDNGSYMFKQLEPLTQYYFRIVPFDEYYNIGKTSSTVSCKTLSGFKSFETTSISYNYVVLTWDGSYSVVEIYKSANGGITYELIDTVSYISREENGSNLQIYGLDDVGTSVVENMSYSATSIPTAEEIRSNGIIEFNTDNSIENTNLSKSVSYSYKVSNLTKNTTYKFYLIPYHLGVVGTSSETITVTTDFNPDAAFTIITPTDYRTLPLYFSAEGLTYPYYTFCKIEISMDNAIFYDVSTIYQVPSIGNPYIYTIIDYSGIDHVSLIHNYTYYVRVKPYSVYGTPGKNVMLSSHSTLGYIDVSSFMVTLNSNIITLNWNGYFKSTYVEYSTDNFTSGSNITSILVYRNESYPSNTTGLISSSYMATTLSTAQTYYFRLKPVNYNGDIAPATISRYNATITDIYLSNVSSTGAMLNWAGTYSTVTIQSSIDGSTFTDVSGAIGISSSSTLISTTNNNLYYRIIPYSSSGFYGRTSNTVYIPVVSAPVLSVLDASRVYMTWSGTMNYANILYSKNDVTYYVGSSKESSPATVSITGMDASNQTYFYKIVPYAYGYPVTNAAYDVSGIISNFVYNPTITTAYFNVLNGNETYNSVSISFKGTYAGLYIYYDVSYNFSSNTYILFQTGNNGASLYSRTISNLLSNTLYYFKIVPYNSNGNNGLHYPIMSTTTNSLLIGLNFAYNASNSTENSIRLTWNNNNYDNLRIYCSNGTYYNANYGTTYYDVTGLAANSIYTFYAIVYDSVGNSEKTSNIFGYTSATSANLNLIYQTSIASGYNITPKKVIFSWDNSGYYSISINTTVGGIKTYLSTDGTTHYDSFYDGGYYLSENTSYVYAFKLTNAYGSEVVFTQTVTTLGTISVFDICKNTFTSSQIPIQFTGIFNDVVIDVSDGVTRGNTYLYGIGSFSNTVTVPYNLTSSNSIISQANKTYWITLYPVNNANNIGLASTTRYAKTLGAITSFYSPRVVDNSSIALYWDGSYASVTIELSTNPSFTTDYVSRRISSSSAAGGSGTSGYIYTGLLPNKQYYFRVTPINQPLSDGNDVSGVTVFNNTNGTTYGKLTSLYTSAYYDTSAVITFDGSFDSLDISVNNITNRYTSQRTTGLDINNLNPGQTYKVTTIINNSSGLSINGNTVTFTTRPKITSYNLTPIDNSSIKVDWYALGSPISVKLIWNTVGITYGGTDSSDTYYATPIYITGLFPNKKYYFQITPTSNVGDGYAYSAGFKATQGKITSFYTSAYYDTSAVITFDGSFDSLDISVNGVTTKYTSQRTTGLDISNLTPGQTYTVTSVIRNIESTTIPGSTTTFKTRSKITGFSANVVDSSSISIVWTATGSVSSVKLIWNTIGTTYGGVTDSSDTYYATPIYITGLYPNKKYYFQITPRSDVGDGYSVNDASNNTWAKLNNFYVDTSRITSTSIPLKWDGSFNRIRIQQSLNGITYTDASNIISYDSSGVTLNGLYSNKQYYIRAIPINNYIVDGAVTREITGTTLAYIGNVYATNITATSFTVNVDLSYGSTYSSFYVSNTTNGRISSFVTYPNNSITLSDLSTNTSYDVVINAYNYNQIDGSGTVVTYSFANTTTLATIINAITANPFTDLSSSYYSITLRGYYTSFKLQYVLKGITYNTPYAAYGSKITVSDLSANTTYPYIVFANNKANGAGTDVSQNFTVTTLGSTPSFNAKPSPYYSQTNSITFDIFRGDYAAVRINTSTTVDMSNGLLYSVDISNSNILTLGNVYIQRDLSVNTLYYFNSIPINSFGDLGNPSTTLPLSTLGNLTSLSLGLTNNITSSSIPISWTGAYDKVRIQYATYSGAYSTFNTYSNSTTPTWTIINTNTVVTGLLPNTRYNFRATPISIDNLDGTTLTLSDVSAMTLPTITTNTISTIIYDTSAVISFDGSFSTVRIYSSPTSLDKTYTWGLGGITTGNDISGLTANTNYTFYYLPYNVNNASNPITGTPIYSSTFYTQPRISPDRITNIDSSSISINWTWIGNTTSASTKVSNSTNGASYSFYSSIPSAGTSVSINNLAANQRYYIALTPKAQSDTSGYTVYMTDNSLVTLGDIISITNTGVTDLSAAFSVTGTFSGVKVYNPVNSTYTYVTGTNSLVPIITNLNSNTAYNFTFYPKNSYESYTIIGVQSSIVTLGNITSKKVDTINSNSSITIRWTGSYKNVYVYTSTDNINYTYYNNTTSNNIAITSLTDNTLYYFKIVPYNTSDISGSSYYISDTSSVTYGSISGINVSTQDSSSIAFNVNGIFSGIYLYNNTTSTATGRYTGTNSVSINNISGLDANTQYTYRFYAINNFGYISNTYTPNTPYTLPRINTATAVPINDSTQLKIDWTYSNNNNSTVTIRTSNNGTDYSENSTGNSGLSKTITSLNANTQYWVRLVPKGSSSNLEGSPFDISGYTFARIDTPTVSDVTTTSAKITVTGTFTKVRIYSTNPVFNITYTP